MKAPLILFFPVKQAEYLYRGGLDACIHKQQ